MAFGKNGKPGKEHRTGGSASSRDQHQGGQARNQADQQRSPNANTRAGRAIIAAKKKEGGKGK